ncbi:hypothetical protein ACVRY7_01610 [Streptococcus ictaluri]|uniref:Uncharacterized protein n=1 Tax=Streptococcus ictaluri 707-05 TaxID=764299 RepID=G5JZJ1_9STRE|nr:hypothetical protein [Streptococcus ictaluri]EHI70980.1 hypothetical protein STRIC_0703 [Streptococcus ictaluri 707-05]
MTYSFITSYLKASVGVEGNFIKVSNPNTILKVIPLGAQNRTIPVEQIATVDDSFKLDLKSFLWGLFFTFMGFGQLSDSFFLGFIRTAYGILTVLSSLQTILTLNLTSGQSHAISVVVFEKEKTVVCKEAIQELISQRYQDTNVGKHTSEQTERLINAMTNQ